jgi:hypothetical protein
MPVSVDQLSSAAGRASTAVTKSLREAKADGHRTGFLCHSHDDRLLASGLVVLLKEAGWDVYVDWQDPLMPSAPTRETALRIQQKIREADFFLFLATRSSVQSRWCPWEIGYADGQKPVSTILIIPTTANGTNSRQ